MSSEAIALDGRSLGKRGAQTRARLLDATAALLESQGVRDLRVVDIARRVGTSPATFYQYFRDVEEAVLALCAHVGEDLAPIGELLEQPWDGAAGLTAARTMVDEFLNYWDAHRAVLRTRNLAAQEGDRRFRDVRNRSLRPLTEGLARKIASSQAGDRGLAPVAASAALVSMLERMAAFHTDLEPMGATRTDVVDAVACIMHQAVTGTSG